MSRTVERKEIRTIHVAPKSAPKIYKDIVADLFSYIQNTSSEDNFKYFVIKLILDSPTPSDTLNQVELLDHNLIDYAQLFCRANKELCEQLVHNSHYNNSNVLADIRERIESEEEDNMESWRVKLFSKMDNLGGDNQV